MDTYNDGLKRRCRALLRISLEQDRLESKYRCERQQVRLKYSGPTSGWQAPFRQETDPALPIAIKAEQLKTIALNYENSEASISVMRELLSDCEEKCHQLLTHLANINWLLDEYESSLGAYHSEMEDVMGKYSMELSSLYKRRLKILVGEHEPSENELIMPEYIRSRTPFNLNFDLQLTDPSIKGVPEFWLRALKVALKPVGAIEPADEILLKYLMDIRYYYDIERDSPEAELNSDHRSQLLLFFFDPNPYFSNRILSKTLRIDKSRRIGCQMYDGLHVIRREGCPINWFHGRNLTRLAGSEQGTEARRASFFNFFSQRGLDGFWPPGNKDSAVDLDYHVFVRFRDFIAAHAIVAYGGADLFGRLEIGSAESSPGPDESAMVEYVNSLIE